MFTGCEFDSESELYYYRARYYDPALGRFLSADPIGFAGQDTNFYRYVENNPLNRTDPSGLKGLSGILDIPDYLDPNAGASIGAITGTVGGTILCGPGCGIAGGIIGSQVGGFITPNSGSLNVGHDEDVFNNYYNNIQSNNNLPPINSTYDPLPIKKVKPNKNSCSIN